MSLPQRYIIDTQHVFDTAYSHSADMYIAKDLVETQGHGTYFHAISVSENAAFRQANHFQFAEWSYPVIAQALADLGFIVFTNSDYVDVYIKLSDGDMTPLANEESIVDFWNSLQDYPDLIDKLGIQDELHILFDAEVEEGITDWLGRTHHEVDIDEISEISDEIHRLARDYWMARGLENANVNTAWAIGDIIKDDANSNIVLCDDGVYRYGETLRVTTLQGYINNGVYFVNDKDETHLKNLVLSLPVNSRPKLGDVIQALFWHQSMAFKIVMVDKNGVVLALPDTPTILD